MTYEPPPTTLAVIKGKEAMKQDGLNSFDDDRTNTKIDPVVIPPSTSFFNLPIFNLPNSCSNSNFDIPSYLNLSNPSVIITATSFLIGESRDGLILLNLQMSYLSGFTGLSEKVVGGLFLSFGLSRALCQPIMGLIIENTKYKMPLLLFMAYSVVALTILTIYYADKSNAAAPLVIIKIAQGAIMCILVPCINSLTLGVIGPKLFSKQVTLNEMAAHASSGLFHLVCGIYSFYAYNSGNVGQIFYLPIIPLLLFTVVAMHFMRTFTLDDLVARGITVGVSRNDNNLKVSDNMSFDSVTLLPRPQTTFCRAKNMPFMLFALCVFCRATVNTVALPLSMQVFASVGRSKNNGDDDGEYSSVKYDTGQNDFLFASMCIVIAQATMVYSASKCTISEIIGRKPIFALALIILTIRCFMLAFLVDLLETAKVIDEDEGSDDDGWMMVLKCLVLSTAVLDGIGSGIFKVLYVVITGDLAAGTGRFPFFISIVSTANTLGATISGFIGEYMADDLGYSHTFFYMGVAALINLVAFTLFFKETKEPVVKPLAYLFPQFN